MLCRTAFSFGLLVRDGDGWLMGPHLDEILGNPASSFYLGRAARIHMMVGKDYRDYVDLFERDARSPTKTMVPSSWRRSRRGSGPSHASSSIMRVPQLPRLKASLSEGARVLDVGCGGGWAIVQIAERFPQVRCVGIDLEAHSVDLARQLIEERGLQDRCEARLESVDRLGEDGAYDLVTSFLVVHEIAPALKASAFAAVARALRPGGCFLIFDEAYPETDEALMTMPTRFAALAQWYEVTWGNVVNTRSELHALCRDAGLDVVEETGFSRFHILVAAKS